MRINRRRLDNIKPKIKGSVKLTPIDDKTGKVLIDEVQEVPNLTVTNGYALLASVLAGESEVGYVGVGAGDTDPALADADLEEAIGSRLAITEAVRSGAIVVYSTFFSTTDNNGTWREAVLATDLSGNNTIIARTLFDNDFHKNSTKRCTLDWSIEIS